MHARARERDIMHQALRLGYDVLWAFNSYTHKMSKLYTPDFLYWAVFYLHSFDSSESNSVYVFAQKVEILF
jgi:hypothetical protein